MKPFHKQRLVTRGCFLGGGVVCMKPFHKQRLVTRGCFLGGGCLQQILKDICFSPGACKQRLVTRVLFWGGGGRTSPKQFENRKLQIRFRNHMGA